MFSFDHEVSSNKIEGQWFFWIFPKFWGPNLAQILGFGAVDSNWFVSALLLWTQSATMTVVRQGVTRGPDGITTPREDLNKGVGTTLVRTPGRAIQYQHSYCTVHTAFTNCWYTVPIFLLYTILAYQLAVDTRHLTILDILFSLRHYWHFDT